MPSRRASGVLLAGTLIYLLSLSPLVGAEVIQKQGLRLTVDGRLLPRKLPREGRAPVAVSLAARIGAAARADTPQLERIEIAINSHGRLDVGSVPRCRYGHINPSTTAQALAACRSSLVGEGHFSADVRLPEQSPFPSEGKILAFNGRFKGRTAIFAHIYGTEPIPTSFVLPFVLRRGSGAYGAILEASLPSVTGNWGFVKAISLKLGGTPASRSRGSSYLSATCPAPQGATRAIFPLARTSFAFSQGLLLRTVLVRTCRVSDG